MTPDRLAEIRAEFEAWFAAEWPDAPLPVWEPEARRYGRTPHNLLLIGWEAAHACYCAGAATEPGGAA